MTGRPEPVPLLLDWRAGSHQSDQVGLCRYCQGPTHLRDSKRKPAHKVCAEQALARQAAETADVYSEGHL